MAQKKNAKTTRIRRAERKNIAVGQAHIKSTFNNTIISITDPQGNVIAWQSAGTVGFKGSRKSTPFAAQMAAEACAKTAMEHGMHSVAIWAAKGVDLREPLKPTVPADFQAMTLPWASVIETMVLLNVERL